MHACYANDATICSTSSYLSVAVGRANPPPNQASGRICPLAKGLVGLADTWAKPPLLVERLARPTTGSITTQEIDLFIK